MTRKKKILSAVALFALLLTAFVAFNFFLYTPKASSENDQASELTGSEPQQEPYNELQLLNNASFMPQIVLVNETIKNMLSTLTSKDIQYATIPSIDTEQTFPMDKQTLFNTRESTVEASSESASSSCEIIDSDIVYGSKLKLVLSLYKDFGERDSKWDYYAVKVTIEDTYAKNDWFNGPMAASIALVLPDWCEDMKHEPDTSFQFSASVASFNYEGIGFSMNLPAYTINFESSKTKYDGWLYAQWTYSGAAKIPFTNVGIAYWYYPFKDSVDASIGFRVPQGKLPYCHAEAGAVWYRFWGLVYVYDTYEVVSYATVKAEGAEVISPPDTEKPKTPASPVYSAPVATGIDAFIRVRTYKDKTFSELEYMHMSGFGRNVYGWHAGTYSIIDFCALLTDNHGNPVPNQHVDIYLVAPPNEYWSEGITIITGATTDENGVAHVTEILPLLIPYPSPTTNPAYTPKGLWWFYAKYDYNGVRIEDECAFTYRDCLLITGYSLAPCWNIISIEDVEIVPENSVIELTAVPPQYFTFNYWWLNFNYVSCENPIYIYMDFDCVALVLYTIDICGW